MSETSKKDNIIQAVKFALFSVSAGLVQIGSFTIINEIIFKAPFTKEFLENHEALSELLTNVTHTVPFTFLP